MSRAVSPQGITEPVLQQRATDERQARCSLRGQIARLERASSRVVAERFPYIAAPAGAYAPEPCPHLLSFAELERLRDHLVWRVHELHHQAAEHTEHMRRSRELLEQMQLEPGRYKFMRLPVANLGQGGCGAWEVRPTFGLDRNARRVVARQVVLWLSVTRGSRCGATREDLEHAGEDRLMPIEHGRRLAELLPQGRLVEIADSYTLICEDQPEELAGRLREFLAEDNPKGS